MWAHCFGDWPGLQAAGTDFTKALIETAAHASTDPYKSKDNDVEDTFVVKPPELRTYAPCSHSCDSDECEYHRTLTPAQRAALTARPELTDELRFEQLEFLGRSAVAVIKDFILHGLEEVSGGHRGVRTRNSEWMYSRPAGVVAFFCLTKSGLGSSSLDAAHNGSHRPSVPSLLFYTQPEPLHRRTLTR